MCDWVNVRLVDKGIEYRSRVSILCRQRVIKEKEKKEGVHGSNLFSLMFGAKVIYYKLTFITRQPKKQNIKTI